MAVHIWKKNFYPNFNASERVLQTLFVILHLLVDSILSLSYKKNAEKFA